MDPLLHSSPVPLRLTINPKKIFSCPNNPTNHTSNNRKKYEYVEEEEEEEGEDIERGKKAMERYRLDRWIELLYLHALV